jgi:anti-anti-sigma factor
MTASAGPGLEGLRGGSHVCWVVNEDAWYGELAAACLADGHAVGQKTVVFGPQDSAALAELRAAAELAVDPHVAFHDGRSLEPETMFTAFREQTERARAEGYTGLRGVADMDWLLPARPTTDAIIAFELLLDRVVGELDATVVCAYRRSSFDGGALAGALCVHPLRAGADDEPQFSLVAGPGRSWRLAGEVDLAVAEAFAAALRATAHEPCVVDVTELDFIDVAGLRTIAETARASEVRVLLRGAGEAIRRPWQLGGFGAAAPLVELLP